MKGFFDETDIYFKSNNKVIIYIHQYNRLYTIKYISRRYQGKALTITTTSPIEENSKDIDDSNIGESTTKKNRYRYRLIYRRFAYYSSRLLRTLYKVTTLNTKIKILNRKRRLCEIY